MLNRTFYLYYQNNCSIIDFVKKGGEGMSDNRIMTIAALRVRMGYSQVELAEILGVGLSTLQKWEKDTSDISLSKFRRIAKLLDYPEEYIFLGKTIDLIEVLHKNQVRT